MFPTLDEFIKKALVSWPHNAWVREPGFSNLYVRISKRNIRGKTIQVLDLASIDAECPGAGAFTNLFLRLRKDYPDLPLFVECVLNPRFAEKLLKLGFSMDRIPNNFYFME